MQLCLTCVIAQRGQVQLRELEPAGGQALQRCRRRKGQRQLGMAARSSLPLTGSCAISLVSHYISLGIAWRERAYASR